MRRIAVFSCAVLFLGLLAASVSTARACDPSDFDAPANLIWCEVRFKPPAPPPTPTRVFVAQAPSAAVTPLAVSAQKAGDSPDTALEITGNPQTIAPGSTLWYKIGINGSHIDFWLLAYGQPGLGFVVYAPNQNLQSPDTRPVGGGSYPAGDPNTLRWAGGSFRQIGTWFARVTNSTGSTLTYLMGSSESAVEKYCFPRREQFANGGSGLTWTVCN